MDGEEIVACGRIQSMGQVCDLDFVFNYCCQPRQQYEKLLIKSPEIWPVLKLETTDNKSVLVLVLLTVNPCTSV